MKRIVISMTLFVLAISSLATAQSGARFTVEELLKVRRVSDPRVSPDGRRIAFVIGDVNYDGNRIVHDLLPTTLVDVRPRQPQIRRSDKLFSIGRSQSH